ncbi:hypothetical protein KM295_15300 [Natronomonas sp. F2-12]|jgi:hypothetical protein|uniref:Uncharacterized protein n=1 Tax=Natronomonas aquatica TaxID=2841590 RepID=A0A9R1CVV1_9EURY|nr:hypothetical protein [Natronomonas aquatica]MCQ4334820.1 hypothetical protein [Natronomonas aquatica]
MTANESTPSNGQEASGTEHEPQTDGGVSRRVFLGAAAAVSTLSAVGGTAAADGGGEEEEYVSPKDSDTDYGREKVVDTSGGLDLHVGMDGNYETSVTVSSHPEGIGLKLSNEIGTMHTLLLPEDIEPLCQELLDAREKTRPEEAEYSREWITEEFRDGDA